MKNTVKITSCFDCAHICPADSYGANQMCTEIHPDRIIDVGEDDIPDWCPLLKVKNFAWSNVDTGVYEIGPEFKKVYDDNIKRLGAANRMYDALEEIREEYIGMEGHIAENAVEEYLARIIKRMYDIAVEGLK